MIRVETPVFEGPYELLIYLVKKREISVYDISVYEITKDFLDYIFKSQELNIPLASEFVFMSAILARIKSEYLLSDEEGKERAKKKLVQLIEEYLKTKERTKLLESLEEKASAFFTNDPSDLIFQFQEKVKIANTLEDLKTAYEKVRIRGHERPKPGINLSSESFRVSDKMEEIRGLLSRKILLKFSEFAKVSSCKLELIVYFLAILELAKLGELATFTDGEELFITGVFKLGEKGEVRREVERTYA